MQEITITVNQEVMEWLNSRALAERCTVEDFASLIIMAVTVNNLKKSNHEKEIFEEA